MTAAVIAHVTRPQLFLRFTRLRKYNGMNSKHTIFKLNALLDKISFAKYVYNAPVNGDAGL